MSQSAPETPAVTATLEPPPVPPGYPSPPPPSSPWGGLAAVYTVLAGVWAVTWTFTMEAGGWVWWQVGVAQDEALPVQFWAVLAGGNAVLVALAMIPLLFTRRWPRLYAAGGMWLGAACVLLLLAATRLVPVAAGEVQLAVQAVVAAVIAVSAWGVRRLRRSTVELDGDPLRRAAPTGSRMWWAAVAGGLTLIPWAWAGALGGPWEILAALAAAVAFAAVAGTVLGDRFWAPFTAAAGWRRHLGGGLAAGVGLAVLGAAFGGPGVQVTTLIVLAALGFLLAGLQVAGARTGRTVAFAVAPAVFGPLAFVDADEFLPLVLGEDFGMWLGIALLIAVVTAWVLGAVCGFFGKRLLRLPGLGAGSMVVVLAAACAVFYYGHPGFHGEHVFVVMSSQADLSGVEEIPVREERLAETYRRLTEHAESSQAELRAELDRRGIGYTPYYLVNAIKVDSGLESRLWLDDRDDVAAVLLNPQSRPVPVDPAPMTGSETVDPSKPQPNITQIGAETAWESGVDGSGITIGISDSGVDGEHPALAGSYRGGADSWADPVNGTTSPNDPNGHGSHALGLALGADGIGVAPGADWIGCANLPRNLGNAADYTACLQFMLAPYAPGQDPFTDGNPARAPHVLTNSWGCPEIEGCDERVLAPAVDALSTAGLFVVVAAGNSGPGCGTASAPPAPYRSSFTVGAVDEDGNVAGFSSRGPAGDGTKPDVSAPGVDVVSALPDGTYGALSGTSMATPHVAGVVALLWQANPELIGDIDATAEILRSTTVPAKGTTDLITGEQTDELDACGGSANVEGAGIVDAAAAVEAARG